MQIMLTPIVVAHIVHVRWIDAGRQNDALDLVFPICAELRGVQQYQFRFRV